MLDSIHLLLDSFPEALIQARDGLVAGANAAARQILPQLQVNAPLPDCLALPARAPSGAGTFTLGQTVYSFSLTSSDPEQIILFRPAPQAALTGPQLAGTLRQLRELLGEMMVEVGPLTGEQEARLPRSAFNRSFHRLFRLLDNLEYMREAGSPGGISFHPTTMNLDALCRETVSRAQEFLSQVGVRLEYESVSPGLLIPGDPELLRQLLLGLISNSARAARDGAVLLTLRRQGARALLTLSDTGPLPSQRDLDALFQRGMEDYLPRPGQGAGLGLSVIRNITAVHRGTMLVQWGSAAPSVSISLPTGPLEPRVSVNTPHGPLRNGGLDPVLVALSDVLPAKLFELEGLD